MCKLSRSGARECHGGEEGGEHAEICQQCHRVAQCGDADTLGYMDEEGDGYDAGYDVNEGHELAYPSCRFAVRQPVHYLACEVRVVWTFCKI